MVFVAHVGVGDGHGGEGVGVRVDGGEHAGGDEVGEVGGSAGEVEEGCEGELGEDMDVEFRGEEREELGEFGGGRG